MNSRSRNVKLSELCLDVIDCPHSTPVWREAGIPIVRNYNLVDGQIDQSNLSYVDQETYKDRIKRANPEPGDIIISREAPMGVVGIVPDGFKCCLGQRLVLLKVDKSKCNPYYLLYSLMSDYVQVQISRINQTGSIVSNLNIPDLKKLKVPYVDRDYQKRIIDVLKCLDSKRLNSLKITNVLKDLIKSIYNYWFLQFDFPNKDGQPYQASGGNMTFNDDMKHDIPSDWKVEKLGDIIEENSKSKIKVKEADNKGDIPFFTSGESILRTENALVSGMNCYLNTGGKADVKFYYGDASYSTDTWSITAKNGLEYYLPLVLDSIKPSMDRTFFQGSTGLKHLQKPLLKSYYICIPDKETLSKFVSIVEPMFKKIGLLEIENHKLKELRDFLLPLLMSGQVVVKS